jgi:hypothetical protein
MKRSRAVRPLFLASIFIIALGHVFAQQTAPPSGMGNACKFDADRELGKRRTIRIWGRYLSVLPS